MVIVPHRIVSEEELLRTSIDLLCEVPAAGSHGDFPLYSLGFLKEAACTGVLLLILALVVFMRCLTRRGIRKAAPAERHGEKGRAKRA